MYTRFTSGLKGRNTLQSDTPLTDEQIMQVAPSVFAEGAWQEVSDKYTFIPTHVTLNEMRKNGFEPFFVAETKARIAGKQGFTKHMLRYRHINDINSQGEVKEIIHVNSHDRTSQDVLMAGFFRSVCANGCFAGTLLQDIKVRHYGNTSDRIIEGAYEIIENFGQVEGAMDLMKSKALNKPSQLAFAQAALVLKYPDKEELPVEPATALSLRRLEDEGDSVYLVYQRLQENLIKGGIPGSNGRMTRGVKGINEMTKLNKALFDLAHNIAKSL
jgi:hypothetical protein